MANLWIIPAALVFLVAIAWLSRLAFGLPLWPIFPKEGK